MIFTSLDYFVFALIVFAGYWALFTPRFQNPFLLASSLFFYGYIHHWFCLLITFTILVNYIAGLLIGRYPSARKTIVWIAVSASLAQLAVFKYFDFFIENMLVLAGATGLHISEPSLRLFLPVGISFYTFQALSYTIDVYRGVLKPRRNLVDFALFIAFFPQLVAGPIERAGRLLPQIERPRRFSKERIAAAFPLIFIGFFKKLVVADNVSIYVDKVFSLAQPSFFLLLVGSIAFTIQIYADFSAYTDIARGSARLLGFELMENFDSPYAALTPVDFWRRWHISFSSWIRDYLYIPLGGSRGLSSGAQLRVLLITFGLSGLWHGAAWNFVAWGIYHAVLLFVYRRLGIDGRWRPTTDKSRIAMHGLMLALTVIGWTLFRASSLGWLYRACTGGMASGLFGEPFLAALYILAWTFLFAMLLWVLQRAADRSAPVKGVVFGCAMVITIVFVRDGGQDFIYFQF